MSAAIAPTALLPLACGARARMDPDEAISAYHEALWSDQARSDEAPLNIVKRTLLAALKQHPRHDDLLIEIGIFHEVVTEEWALALTYFDRVTETSDYNHVFYKARCLACLLRKDEALALIDGSGLAYDQELMRLRQEIADDEWADYARMDPGSS
jgi:hypothetical protein